MAEFPKVMQIISGGLDSLVTARILYNQGYQIYGVYINAGQPNHERALASTQRICDKYCVLNEGKGIEIITISSNIRDTFTVSRKENNYYTGTPQTLNTFISVGSMLLPSLGIKYLASGVKDDTNHYDFNKWRENVNYIHNSSGMHTNFTLLAPLQKYKTIEETVKRGLDEGLTLEEMSETVSCNRETTCGECVKCKGREKLGLKIN